ncbi:LysR family transcriptional regulator [Phyllobacterium myrsinacearum]|uniref:DNA-binding transcriptional LysR family regulator n=1 Tax=Phyllobacterium myrsinacearum TaxID=28101 RepID=A0A839EMH2_9HYPH|nr:LysR family transcriptional regulator [Phyllobacterium myrsinacearum]MBA8879405.1 DNA-binding transcriptional LysR family regulator [Phyllobacterium myrsinacearum]
MITLDVDSVQAFVLVADLRSFTKAAEALDTSQAAVSVKLKRLEEKLGQKLIERTPRLVRLSVQGAAFLEAGRAFLAAHERAVAGLSSQPRRLALGINVHVAGPELPVLLARLNAHDPALCMEVHVDTSRDLLAAYDKGSLDAVIVRREDNRRDGEVLSQDRFGWFASPDFQRRDHEPLRLASLASSCGVRSIATRALDAADIAWTEVFVGGGMAAVGAAVSIGLAVAALARRVAPIGTVEVGERLGLPRLPEFDIVMHSSLSDARSRGALRTLATAFRDHR